MMTYKLNEMDDINVAGKPESVRLRVTISNDDKEVGVLYFERAKSSFQNKPLSMNSWRCVDAKVFGLYEGEENEIPIPKDIIKQCQDLIKEAGY